MRKLIIITIIIALGLVVYNQVKTPDWVKVNQEMTELCSYSNTEDCD